MALLALALTSTVNMASDESTPKYDNVVRFDTDSGNQAGEAHCMTEDVMMVPSEITRPPNEHNDDLRFLMLGPITLTNVPPLDGPLDGIRSVTTGMR